MEGQGENEELYPIAVLIDELKVIHYKMLSQLKLTFTRSMTTCS